MKYLWVLEYGELNNRLHYHVLCNYEFNIKLSNSNQKKSIDHKQLENEFQDRYWEYGFVDIRQLQEEDNTNIALYVSTYTVKSLFSKDLEYLIKLKQIQKYNIDLNLTSSMYGLKLGLSEIVEDKGSILI